jgi:hypothetical protein
MYKQTNGFSVVREKAAVGRIDSGDVQKSKGGWGSTILRFLTVPVPDGIENATHNTFGT